MTPPCPPTGAMMRRKLSVLLITIFCTMLNFPASSCATCSNASSCRGFHFFPESVFIFFPVSTVQGGEAFLHYSVRAIRVMAAFHGWRFQLPMTLYSRLLFFFSQLSKPLYSVSFLEKVFPHQILPRYAFFSTTCLHCTFVSGFLLLPLHTC